MRLFSPILLVAKNQLISWSTKYLQSLIMSLSLFQADNHQETHTQTQTHTHTHTHKHKHKHNFVLSLSLYLSHTRIEVNNLLLISINVFERHNLDAKQIANILTLQLNFSAI